LTRQQLSDDVIQAEGRTIAKRRAYAAPRVAHGRAGCVSAAAPRARGACAASGAERRAPRRRFARAPRRTEARASRRHCSAGGRAMTSSRAATIGEASAVAALRCGDAAARLRALREIKNQVIGACSSPRPSQRIPSAADGAARLFARRAAAGVRRVRSKPPLRAAHLPPRGAAHAWAGASRRESARDAGGVTFHFCRR
jgi:hypothetical protein